MDTYVIAAKEKKGCEMVLDISRGWECAMTSQKEYPSFGEAFTMDELEPISEKHPKFAGVIRYEKEIDLDKSYGALYIHFEHVYEAMTLWINGEKVGICITEPYEFEISSYVKPGKNSIRIEAATTLDRDQLNYPAKPFDFYHETMEPTGIYGKVTLTGR